MVLPSFDEEITNDILVLAVHFNGLLNFGTVKVNIKDNCVEVRYSRYLLANALSTEDLKLGYFYPFYISARLSMGFYNFD